jgi:hypothetical protein
MTSCNCVICLVYIFVMRLSTTRSMDVQKEYTGPEDGCWLLTLSVAYVIFILSFKYFSEIASCYRAAILKM